MRNIKIVLEYDGTYYAGWQIQPKFPTVHGALSDAVGKLIGAETKVIGASRTDAGVHATGQVANFLTEAIIPLKGIANALNALLPPDIAVRQAEEVSLEFDSRKDAKSKTYLYRVLNGGFRTALFRDRCWHVMQPLDIGVMQKGAGLFVGKKDFSSFRAADCDSLHPMREIISFTVTGKEDGFIDFTVKGTAFLRHMVRIMAGTLVTAGRARITLDDISAIIEARDRTSAPLTAPAKGLFLKEVEY